MQQDGILWADGAVITRDNAHLCGVGDIFDRVQVELVGKMKEMKMVSVRCRNREEAGAF